MYKTKSGKNIDYSNIKKKTVFKSTLENGVVYQNLSPNPQPTAVYKKQTTENRIKHVTASTAPLFQIDVYAEEEENYNSTRHYFHSFKKKVTTFILMTSFLIRFTISPNPLVLRLFYSAITPYLAHFPLHELRPTVI